MKNKQIRCRLNKEVVILFLRGKGKKTKVFYLQKVM